MACGCTNYLPLPGPPGPPGPGGSHVQAVTAHPLGGHRLVVPRDDGLVEYADATNPAHANRPIWMTTAAWDAGVTADLLADGEASEPSWSWTPGVPLLLGIAGVPTQTLPPGAVMVRRVGLPVTATSIYYRPAQPVVLA